jgi:hypothetical protein
MRQDDYLKKGFGDGVASLRNAFLGHRKCIRMGVFTSGQTVY